MPRPTKSVLLQDEVHERLFKLIDLEKEKTGEPTLTAQVFIVRLMNKYEKGLK